MYTIYLGYSPLHRNQVSRQLKIYYKQHYNLIKDELKQVYRLGVTFDFWSTRQSESCICITGHWINNSWDLVSKIIDFSCFNSQHTATEIAKVLEEKLVSLGIYDKVISITCDGAENLVLACELLNENIRRIWCCAHRLHLVVVNALGFWIAEKEKNNCLNIDLSISITTNHVTTFDNNANIINKDDIDIDWDHKLDESKPFYCIYTVKSSIPNLFN